MKIQPKFFYITLASILLLSLTSLPVQNAPILAISRIPAANTTSLAVDDVLLPLRPERTGLQNALSYPTDLTADSAAANLDPVAQTNVGASSNNIPDNWLERFNYYRQAAGLPAVVESSAYSADLAKHVNYMLLNVPTEGLWHGETPGRPGYTAEGAQAAAESNLFWFPSGVSYATPAIAIDGWMSSIHHRYGMLNPELVTTGFGIGCDTQNCGAGLNVIRGLVSGNAPRPDGVIYPGPNQSNVNTDIILTWQFLWEPTVVLKNASLQNSSGQLIPITTTSPPNGDYFNMVSVKPNTVLSPGTTYTASMSVQLGDRQLDQTWNFTTAPIPAPPGAATLVSPSGGISNTTPTYTWNKVSDATNYVFWLGRVNSDNSLTPILEQAFESSVVCGGTTCSITPGVTLSSGNYRWWIRTSNSYGYGPWSSPMNFSLSTIPLPGVATLVSPTGSTTNTTPAYTWNKVNAATWYYLWISSVNSDGSFTTVHSKWYESSAVCSGATCSITPAGVTLSSNNYRWWIQTWNDGGYGPWSSPMNFSLSTIPLPGKATLVSPSGGITDTTPTYTWNKVNAATWYYLWASKVNGDGSLTTAHSKWYESSAACSGATCSITPAGVTLTSGNYRWWIQTWNDGGYGPWSSLKNFTVSP